MIAGPREALAGSETIGQSGSSSDLNLGQRMVLETMKLKIPVRHYSVRPSLLTFPKFAQLLPGLALPRPQNPIPPTSIFRAS